MKILNPFMGTAASGSLQGITVGHTRAGYAVRQKADPPIRFRGLQMSNRSILSFLSVYWSSLTQGQRDGWGVWAASHPRRDGFGGTFIMSGFNAFIHCNQCRMSEFPGTAAATAAPTVILAAQIATLVAGAGVVSGSISVAWTFLGTGSATDSVQIATSNPHIGFGCFDGLKGWKKSLSVAGNLLTGAVLNLIPSAVYGVRVRYVNLDGQRSNWVVKNFAAHV